MASIAPSPPTVALTWRDLLGAGAVTALFLVLFEDPFLRLLDLWGRDPNYSHGYLIPLLSGWLAWRNGRRAGMPVQGEMGLGALAILAGCTLRLAGAVVGWLPLDFLALVLILRGVTVTVGGREWAKGFTFPILFLFFMFPLPGTWTSFAALGLQDLVSRVAAWVLDFFVVCYRQGNALHLAGVPETMTVAEECSGLRQIVAFVALGALVGHLSQRSLPFCLLLVLTAVPVAVFANVVRILLMAAGACLFGTSWIHGWLHHAPALFTMPVGLVLYLAVAWSMGRFWPRPAKGGAA
jgi:exosortase